MTAQKRVNCRVHGLSNGSRQLLFTLEGTNQCVGEINVSGDVSYLIVMAEMFSQWAGMERKRPVLASSIHRALNG